MDFEPVNITPRNTNSVIVRYGKKTYAFDPWGTFEQWADRDVDAVFVTHGHFDHISAMVGWDIPWYMNPDDIPVMEHVGMRRMVTEYFTERGRASWTDDFLNNPPTCRPMDLFAIPTIGDMQIIKTPGHTPGGVCFYFPGDKFLLSGDTLFYDTIGRTDLPLSNSRQMAESINILKNFGFPDDLIVIPGHGRHGYWGDIRKVNRFLI